MTCWAAPSRYCSPSISSTRWSARNASEGRSVTLAAWGQLALYVALVFLTTKPLGSFMYRVFETDRRPLSRVLGPVERLLFRLSGVDPGQEQTWVSYAGSVLIFSLFGVLVTYAILRFQQLLPLNPQRFGAV